MVGFIWELLFYNVCYLVLLSPSKLHIQSMSWHREVKLQAPKDTWVQIFIPVAQVKNSLS